ncbi:interferon lambda receptor 1 isoform X2 [Genypterus blacodes]|uniref:interferon lambda receptor 1 isoform X2 n=1 Tax=Genypterus blacodes TaxID=154954 RepID=UPI003F76FE0B
MWSLKVILLLLCCYACLSTSHRRPYFISRNFHNVLHWEPLKSVHPGEQVLYTVQYCSDATKQLYQPKAECTNITTQSCDLTAETPSVTYVRYMAQVLANGRGHGRTIAFKPIADTVLGQPKVSIHSTVSSLQVNVTLPLGPHNISIADIFNSTKSHLSKPLTEYFLYITHPKWAAQVNKSTSGQFDIKLKNNDTKYCGYVVYKPNFEHGRPLSENSSFCFMLQDPPRNLLPWLLMGACFLAVLALTSVVCMCCYVRGGKEKSAPISLVATFSIPPSVSQPPDKNICISKAEFCSQTDQTVYSTIRVKPSVPSVTLGGYSPQDTVPAPPGGFHSSNGAHSSASCQDTSMQSLASYAQVHIPADEEDNFQQDADEESDGVDLSLPPVPGQSRWDQGDTKLASYSAPQLPDLNCNKAGPLLLNTVRDPNGQLMLPTLFIELQNSTVSPSDQEGKSLLSDLMDPRKGPPSLSSLHSLEDSGWSDSGCDQSTGNTPTQLYCNSHFSSTQPLLPSFHVGSGSTGSTDETLGPGYKQNWMPAIYFGKAPGNSLEHGRTNPHWTWTDPKKQEEAEEETEVTASHNLLGGWMVHIQE